MRITPYTWIPIISQFLIRSLTLFYWHYLKRAAFNVTGHVELELIKGPVLFVCNHVSEWDSLLVRSVMPLFSRYSPICAVSLPKRYYRNGKRSALRSFFYGGLFFKMIGAFPANKGAATFEEKLERHVRILSDGNHVIIFPEGGVSLDGTLGGFRKGAAFLALRTGATVVPVSIGESLHKSKRWLTPRPILRIRFGEPIRYGAARSAVSITEEELTLHSQRLREIIFVGNQVEPDATQGEAASAEQVPVYQGTASV